MKSKKGKPVTAHQTKQINDSTIQALMSILTDEPQTRAYLSFNLGITDRTLRQVVQAARLQGYPICSKSQQAGYWIGTEKEVRQTIKEYEKRGLNDLEVARKMKAKLLNKEKQLNGQIEMEI